MGIGERIWEKYEKVDRQIFYTDLKAIISVLVGIQSNIKVFVFGSIAKNSVHFSSDIDLAVILPSEVDKKSFMASYFKIRKHIERPVDIIFRSQLEFDKKSKEDTLDQVIAEEGKEVFPIWSLHD